MKRKEPERSRNKTPQREANDNTGTGQNSKLKACHLEQLGAGLRIGADGVDGT